VSARRSGEALRVPYDGRAFDAHLYLPETAEPAPGILYLHDIFGVIGGSLGDASDLAGEGFVVLVPDLYSLFGRTKYCIRSFFHPASLTNSAANPALPEIAALVEHLKAHERVDGERLGIFGQCLTGGYVLHMAKRSDMRAPVLNHHSFGVVGTGFPDADAAGVRNTVQGHFVEKDPLFCLKRKSEGLKRQLGDRLEYLWYPGIKHGIRTVERRTPQAAESWEATKRFYRESLLRPSA